MVSSYNSILDDLLSELNIKHTIGYSNRRLAAMSFKTLFGMSKLLQDYGVSTQGVFVEDRALIRKLPLPFIAVTNSGLIVVCAVDDKTVDYVSSGVHEEVDIDSFNRFWTGEALLVDSNGCMSEPEYRLHCMQALAERAKRFALPLLLIAIFLFLWITNGLYDVWSTYVIALIDLIGLWMSYMLMQKTLNIHTSTADRVCGVIQAGGCDDVLKTKASSFYGIFSWSEVGLTYFAVSLVAMIVFPQSLPSLALCNLCCLPFTVWSIWYQRFRAHAWCAMCVCVQASLWVLFICYLCGGWLRMCWPVGMDTLILIGGYVIVLLGINRLKNFYLNRPL